MDAQVKRRKKFTATEARNLRTLLLLNVLEPEKIGARIAQARVEAGLTQEELGDLIDVSTRSIQGYEAGGVKPYRHLEKLAVALDKTVAWLLHGDEDSPVTEAEELLATEAFRQEVRATLSAILERLEADRPGGEEAA